MSRIGKSPVIIPAGVAITLGTEDIEVSGPKGTLHRPLLPEILVKQEENQLVLSRQSDEPKIRAKHGLMRSLIHNMVTGVSQGFNKKLEINGVGYRVNIQGSDVKLNLGFSHDVIYHLPQGVTASVEQNVITLSGIDNQRVGQAAAEIRALKKPEPYKGKGIKYVGERIIRKSGKSGKEK